MRAHAGHWRQPHHLAADLAVLRHDVQVEAGQYHRMVEVQDVLVGNRIQLPLPQAEAVQVDVDVAAAPQIAHLIVQNLDALQDEVDFVAERRVMVQQLHAVDHGEDEADHVLLGVLREVLGHVAIQVLVNEDSRFDVENVGRKFLRGRRLKELARRCFDQRAAPRSRLHQLAQRFRLHEVLLRLERRIAEALLDQNVRADAESLGKRLNEHVGVVHPINSAL